MPATRGPYNGFYAAFPSAVNQSCALPEPRTLTELAMVKLSASIRAKPDWWSKYKDSEIRAKWKAEALKQTFLWVEAATMLVPIEDREKYTTETRRAPIEVSLSERQIDYVLDELDGYSKLHDEASGIQVSCFDGIWQSDTLIPATLRASLIDEVSVLENVPEKEKDWHPNSDNQVLDLVHPSLYPVIYDRTLGRFPDPNGPLAPIKYPFFTRRLEYGSTKFQWLPTDFQVDEKGDVKALGYINNLHPSHEGLYKCIERAIKCFIPLWELVLTDMRDGLPLRISDPYLPIEKADPNYPKKNRNKVRRRQKTGGGGGGEEEEDEPYNYDEDYYSRVDDYMELIWPNNKIVGLPDVPEEGYPGGLELHKHDVSLKGTKLQIIVKLANIHLTPDKPEYKGGSWHLEGMVNERIVASGIYYYDQENITSSELAFRIAVGEPKTAERQAESNYDYYAHEVTYGFVMAYDESTKLNNVVGATETSEGRCIAFPNTYQHRVTPFRLVDASKPGYRKILALFLIDPAIAPIPSTTNVPPQQAFWAVEALSTTNADAPVRRLPPEILNMIKNDPVLMDDHEAKKLRIELMEERTNVLGKADDNTEFLFSRSFNLCEH